MYSTSCPDGCASFSIGTIGTDDLSYLDREDWIEEGAEKFNSEDCLSLLSNEYDQCPEFDDFHESEVEFDNLAGFEMIETPVNKHRPLGSNKFGRRGSDTVKELSLVLLNKLNRKFYSIRIADWLKIKTRLNANKAIYMLGKKYFFNKNPDIAPHNLLGKKEFMSDFVSRFWFTYRQNFRFLPCPKLVENDVPDVLRTSDVGWGCMIRSGQMLMAQGLCMHFLGRMWTQTSSCPKDQAFHSQVIKWFGDFDKVTNPFSIHRIIRYSSFNPGHWFGPFSICNALTQAFYKSRDLEPKLQCLEVYFSFEQTIYRDEIYELMQLSESDQFYTERKSKSVIILLPLFLGSKSHNSKMFTEVINKWLRDQCCLGIIGGKPQHAIYIIGCQDNHIIYLDPHFLQDIINVNEDNFPLESYHCKKPLVMSSSYLDPNCAVGFYCEDINDLNMFLMRLPDLCKVCVKTNKDTVFRQVIDIQPGYHPKFKT